MYQQSQKGNVWPTGPVRGKRKLYTPTVDQADASEEVVTSIILVHSAPDYVLFDSMLLTSLFHLNSLVSMIYHVILYSRLDN